ncbi:MAG: DUF721 domain-containing protein [Proteobacteria bacterium]|nr:DUF721 domain-containing protein [Pseudomonadota bacterium]
MKRKGKLTRVGAVLKPVLRSIGKGQPGVHPEIWARWNEIVGENLARRAIPRSLQGKILTIAVANSSWMQEMSYLKPALIEQFGEAVGENVVKDIRLVLSPSITTHRDNEPEKKSPPVIKEVVLPAEIVAAAEAVQDHTLRKNVEKALKANWPNVEKK